MIKHLQLHFTIGLFLTFFFTYGNCSASTVKSTFSDSVKTDSPWYKKLSVIAGYQYFRTCHHSRFDGGYAFVDYDATTKFSMGLGIAYDYSELHMDNGYNLRHVKVLPILADFRYVPFPNWIVCPFAVADVGYSTFIKYEQEDPTHVESTRNITDHGLYTFGGAGVSVKLSGKVTIYTTAGFTGMHMSFNNMDVNPRGLSNEIGVKVNLR
ncbi:MAG: hypothetical protein M3O71_05095 [Bacteroidota bacterium]|nr:hypothetical protein [Bacteroidota bacterium]